MDKVSSFFVGNVVGITILVAGVLITAPQKIRESEAIKKQELALKTQTANANPDRSKPNEPTEGSTAIESAAPSKLKAQSAQTTSALSVVAKKAIKRGNKISKNDISVTDNFGETSSELVTDINKVVGKTAHKDIPKGSAITTDQLE